MKRGIPIFWFACTVGLAQQYVAWTVAGGGQPFTPVAAVNASIAPGGLATDAGGNVYIRGFQCVLKVDPRGTLTLVAGNGRAGSAQDGVPTSNLRLRVVSPAGIITTAFGGPSPDPNAQLHADAGVALDAAGNIYVADGDAVLRLQPAGQNISLNSVANAVGHRTGVFQVRMAALKFFYTRTLKQKWFDVEVQVGRMAGRPLRGKALTQISASMTFSRVRPG